MIAEAFLMCALAPAPMAMAHHEFTNGPMQAVHTVISTAEFARYRTKHNGKILLAGGDPTLVAAFRIKGVEAFGILTDDQPGATRWHVVGNAGKLPVLSRAFQFVYWLQNNPAGAMAIDVLMDAAQAVSSDGLFIFSSHHYPDWPVWLNNHGWELLPFRADDYLLYQRPHNGGHPKFIRRLLEESA